MDEELTRRADETAIRFGGGRLGTYALLGGASGTVPLPWVPDFLVRRVRGALLHDVAARHGVSMTPEARRVLEDLSGADGLRGALAHAVRFGVRRVLGRLGPLSLFAPMRSALSTFVLGHLVERYITIHRIDTSSTPLHLEEARRLRRAVDRALLDALTSAGLSHDGATPALADGRDHVTQMLDNALIAVAGVPGWLIRRLESAFDAALPETRG